MLKPKQTIYRIKKTIVNTLLYCFTYLYSTKNHHKSPPRKKTTFGKKENHERKNQRLKMAAAAAKYMHPKMYYYVENHLKSETASTDQFHMMCKGHVPVHLFESCTDQEFVKYHYDVSFFESLLSSTKYQYLAI